ncbi:LysR substrate-binding domain-containing protein [Streptomyces sp. MST-110588]|uniref:LysR family transcriptional regulator n=1 Tax=Streptomyces sp. MST-110588 TaxID=2833628 RepID=UPI001F5CED3A|nr:LysR substrate-binding domain-containing protein [Streptomyces sp. MST-110588]UNO41537.1 LysR family transcriptional regulator [Streptomyces sp. MST-110588]
MELRQLEYLVAVVEEASFTKAAAKLHVAQSGVSAQVRQLEREFGQRLLDRSGRTVRPTRAGEAVLPYAIAALDAVAGARFSVDELTGLLRGRVVMGMVSTWHPLGLPPLLAAFHRAHPGVEITLSEATSDHLLEALHQGRVDAAIIAVLPRSATPPGITTHVVADQPLVAAVALDDELASADSVALAELRDRSLMSLPRGTGLRARLDQACAEVNITPRIAFETGNPWALAELAAEGLGVAILPYALAAHHPGRLHLLPIRRPEIRAQLALAWREGKPLNPAARALITHLKNGLPTEAAASRPPH